MLALFDLDGTLIDGDSNHLWNGFLIELGVVDPGGAPGGGGALLNRVPRGAPSISPPIWLSPCRR